MNKYIDIETNKGFSSVVSLFLIGFLIVSITGVFNLVLRELNDNRGLGNYIKASAGAESAQELALLKIKQEGYGYYDKIEFSETNRSIVLSDNPTDESKFRDTLDVVISYDLNSKTNNYDGELGQLGYDIIPLFFLNSSNSDSEIKSTDINLSVSSDLEANNLSWNIVSKSSGISGIGVFDHTDLVFEKKIDDLNAFSLEQDIEIGDFLENNSNNYLILFNTSNSSSIKYTLSSKSSYFTKPTTEIISSAKVGKYRQNLKTVLNNTDYLNILKYSIYSN